MKKSLALRESLNCSLIYYRKNRAKVFPRKIKRFYRNDTNFDDASHHQKYKRINEFYGHFCPAGKESILSHQ
jgi:hypothetical protein